jgi:hypothetical protein
LIPVHPRPDLIHTIRPPSRISSVLRVGAPLRVAGRIAAAPSDDPPILDLALLHVGLVLVTVVADVKPPDLLLLLQRGSNGLRDLLPLCPQDVCHRQLDRRDDRRTRRCTKLRPSCFSPSTTIATAAADAKWRRSGWRRRRRCWRRRRALPLLALSFLGRHSFATRAPALAGLGGVPTLHFLSVTM